MTSQSDVARDSAEAKKPMRSSRGSDVSSIRYFPVTMFAGILGLCGTGLAWRKAAEVLDLPFIISKLLFGFGLGYALAVLVLYGFKLGRHPKLVMADLTHPVRGNYLPAAPLGLLLIAEILSAQLPLISDIFWLTGVAATLALTVLILNQWIDGRYKPHEITPAWFVPSVALLVAPVTGAPLGFQDLSWMMLAIGLIFWITLMPITLHRLFFRRAISPSLAPSLFIFTAPPALACVAVTRLGHGYMDGFAKFLLGAALFTFFMVLPRWRRFVGLPFGMSWWAYTYPTAALATACLHYHDQTGSLLSGWLAGLTLLLASLATLVVTACTLNAFAQGHLFRGPKS
ncbi:SLAC1 anion channel family protein [Aestuariispira insulae]|nr:SLAC1 anion channel family protein [Aestuariispira insulae]